VVLRFQSPHVEERCLVAYLMVVFSFFSSFVCNDVFIDLGTKSLMQRELWKNDNLSIQTINKIKLQHRYISTLTGGSPPWSQGLL